MGVLAALFFLYFSLVADYYFARRLVLLSSSTLVRETKLASLCQMKIHQFNLPFYIRFEPYVFETGKKPPNPSYEETTLFYLMTIGSIVAAFVFCPSQPYSRNGYSTSKFILRKSTYTYFKFKTFLYVNDVFRGLQGLGLHGYDPDALHHVYQQ